MEPHHRHFTSVPTCWRVLIRIVQCWLIHHFIYRACASGRHRPYTKLSFVKPFLFSHTSILGDTEPKSPSESNTADCETLNLCKRDRLQSGTYTEDAQPIRDRAAIIYNQVLYIRSFTCAGSRRQQPLWLHPPAVEALAQRRKADGRSSVWPNWRLPIFQKELEGLEKTDDAQHLLHSTACVSNTPTCDTTHLSHPTPAEEIHA